MRKELPQNGGLARSLLSYDGCHMCLTDATGEPCTVQTRQGRDHSACGEGPCGAWEGEKGAGEDLAGEDDAVKMVRERTLWAGGRAGGESADEM